MSRTGQTPLLIATIVGFIVTPIIMIAGLSMFGTLAAARFKIYDFATDYASGVAAALLLLCLIIFWPVPPAHRRALAVLWLARIGIALGAMLPYEARYTLDASWYYRSGINLSDPIAYWEFGEGTTNVIAIVGVIAALTTSYSAIKIIFCYFGLASIYIFYRATVLFLGRDVMAVLYILGLFPSQLFWTSILGKDPIVALGISIFCYGVVGFFVRRSISMTIYMAIGLAIATSIRVWLGVIFLCPIIITLVLGSRVSIITKISLLLLSILGAHLSLQGFAERFSIDTTQDLIETTDQISNSWAHGGSAQEIEREFTSIRSLILFMPIGLFTALFRPLPFEVTNIFGAFAGLENIFLLGMYVIGVMRSGIGWVRNPILMWALLTLVVWGAFYGFASYQNLGTAFRFRAQVAPILLLLGLYLMYSVRLHRARIRLVVSRQGTEIDNP